MDTQASGARELTDSEIAYLFADDPDGYLNSEEHRILADFGYTDNPDNPD